MINNMEKRIDIICFIIAIGFLNRSIDHCFRWAGCAFENWQTGRSSLSSPG